MNKPVILFGVGDVFIDRDDPSTAFRAARTALVEGDIVFGNCEGVYSDTWERAPSSGSPVVAPTDNAKPLADAPFHVMSLANNHSLDGGHQALLNTQKTLRESGVRTVGAGADIAEARAAEVVARRGTTVAFLAYSSVFPHGYEARAAVPGLAPLRAHTHYTPWELNEWNPGLNPRVSTVPFPQDIGAFCEDIAAARRTADIVVVSVHWGDFTRPYVLTDHERRAARLAIDTGADVVFGHHHHLLRGIEFFRGKPIFYGLGHYLFDLPRFRERVSRDGYLSAATPEDEIALARRFGEYRIGPREGYPLLPFHPDSRMTGIAVVVIQDCAVHAAGWRPAVIDSTNEPIPVSVHTSEGARVIEYLRRCGTEEQLGTDLVEPQPDSGLPEDSIQAIPSTSEGEQIA